MSDRALHFPSIDAWMTPDRAASIRTLRVEHGLTWRAIAATCAEQYGGDWTPPWNQLAGVDLCAVAQSYFDEDWEAMPMPWDTSSVNVCPFCGADATVCGCGKVRP